MEAFEAVAIKAAAHRIAKRRGPAKPSMTAQVTLPDALATFDPINEVGRPVASGKIMPKTVLNTSGRRGGRLGSMIDTPYVTTPERALMAAVLREAVREQDLEWANDETDEGLFSVTSICDTLGISIDMVRRAMQ